MITPIMKRFTPTARFLSTTVRPEPQVASTLIDIGCRQIFNHDHDMFRKLCRNFYATQVTPNHREWEDQGHVPRDIWKKAGSNGMLCVTMPEQYGGEGQDVMFAAVTWEERGYAGASGVGFALHSEVVAPYILHYGSEEQKIQFLPKMASGEFIASIAMTEPGAGSDLQGMRTTAVKSGSDYVINGSKTFITNGYHADVCIVCAKTLVGGKDRISLFLVDTTTPGFKKGKKLKKLGMKAQDTVELFFEDMRVPQSALLGEEGKGLSYLMAQLPQERLLVSESSMSAAEACYEWTRAYVKERKAFGSTISSLQTVRHRLATMKTEICIGRTFVDHCLKLQQSGTLDYSTASMAKLWSSELQARVVDEAVQLHGGAGYMLDYPVARAFVDGRVARIYGGANEIMKELIARGI